MLIAIAILMVLSAMFMFTAAIVKANNNRKINRKIEKYTSIPSISAREWDGIWRSGC